MESHDLIYHVGLVVCMMGGTGLALLMILSVIRITWYTYKEIVGWQRILKAVRLLSDTERDKECVRWPNS